MESVFRCSFHLPCDQLATKSHCVFLFFFLQLFQLLTQTLMQFAFKHHVNHSEQYFLFSRRSRKVLVLNKRAGAFLYDCMLS